MKIYGLKEIQSLKNDWRVITSNHSNEQRSAYLIGKRWLNSSPPFPVALLNEKVIAPAEKLAQRVAGKRTR